MSIYWSRPLIVYPTFLKSISFRPLAALWQQAASALARADLVDIYGYSLPESDGAVRALLNILPVRLARQAVRVRVHDPNAFVRKRWMYFLGKRARATGDRLG